MENISKKIANNGEYIYIYILYKYYDNPFNRFHRHCRG